jgi:hypothetical protein
MSNEIELGAGAKAVKARASTLEQELGVAELYLEPERDPRETQVSLLLLPLVELRCSAV